MKKQGGTGNGERGTGGNTAQEDWYFNKLQVPYSQSTLGGGPGNRRIASVRTRREILPEEWDLR